MKNHIPIELLSGYLDDELDAEQKKEIAGHLKECKFCRDELQELKTLNSHIRDAEIEEPSREFFFNLNHRVMEKIKKKPGIQLWRFMPIMAPVAIGLLIFIFVNVHPQRKLVEIDDKISYREVRPAKELELPLAPKSAIQKKVIKMKTVSKKEELGVAAKPGAEIAKSPILIDEKTDELTSLNELKIPEGTIVRAIIDSAGKVMKIATGKTIVPQKDTILQNRFAGRQLAAPAASQRGPRYIEITQWPSARQESEAAADSTKEDSH